MHVRAPLARHLARRGGERGQRPRPHLRRLVIEQQRRDQVALVERLEHVDGVEHPPLVGIGELAHEGLDGRQIRTRQAQRLRFHLTALDAGAERRDVAALGANRRVDPQRADAQAGVADLLPREVEAPRRDQDEGEQRAHAFGETIDRDVDERLRALLQVAWERQEQNLARRLVDRVAQRRVEHARQRRRPERGIRQHHARRRSKAHREDQQREADPELAMDAAGEQDLDQEARDRRVELHGAEKLRQAVHLVAALEGLGRHVQLLFDQVGADRGKGDDQRDDLQVLRLAQHAQRFGAAHAFLFARRRDARELEAAGAPLHRDHDRRRDDQQRAADEEQVRGADLGGGEGQNRRSDDAAEAGAAADEAEEPLGLARVVDLVGERPELADEQNAHDQPEQVEAGGHHPGSGLEQHPEDDEQDRHHALRRRDHPFRLEHPGAAAVALHDHADHEAGEQRHVGDVVGPQVLDELRSRDRLQDVVGRHREERVEEHQDERDALRLAHFHDGAKNALQDAAHGESMVCEDGGAAAQKRRGAEEGRNGGRGPKAGHAIDLPSWGSWPRCGDSST